MDRYAIFCTEEQTKKALELGAPILSYPVCRGYFDDLPKCTHKGKVEPTEYSYIPTAEQMIGWLEEQKILIEFKRVFGEYAYRLMEAHKNGEMNTHIQKQGLSSRKEATLAAVDAALDYLILKNKQDEIQ